MFPMIFHVNASRADADLHIFHTGGWDCCDFQIYNIKAMLSIFSSCYGVSSKEVWKMENGVKKRHVQCFCEMPITASSHASEHEVQFQDFCSVCAHAKDRLHIYHFRTLLAVNQLYLHRSAY